MPTTSVDKHLQAIDADETKTIGLMISGKTITKGQFVAKAAAQTAPGITLNSASGAQTYLAVSLDLTAPYVSFPILSPILHWIQPGYTASGPDGTLATTSPWFADWLAPGPPPGSDEHKYVVFLYALPADFDVNVLSVAAEGQNPGLMARVRFDYDAWEVKTGIQDKFVGGTYFMSK